MSWQREAFREHYRRTLGTAGSSNSYVSYLNLVDQRTGGLNEGLAREGLAGMSGRLSAMPDQTFSGGRTRANCQSALNAYAGFIGAQHSVKRPVKPRRRKTASALAAPDPLSPEAASQLLQEVKALGAKYRHLTGRPLGVVGEVAELEAAEKLGLELMPARCPDYDAIKASDGRRIQVKGRALDPADRYRGRCPAIKAGAGAFDSVVLVLLDRSTLEPLEMLQAEEHKVIDRLEAPGSRARNERRSLAITQFKSIAEPVWPARDAA